MNNNGLPFAILNAHLVDGSRLPLEVFIDEMEFYKSIHDEVASAFECDEDGILKHVSVDIFRCPNASVTVLDSN